MTSRHPIRWGILSTAHIADLRLVPAVAKSSNGFVHCVASRDVEKAKTFASKHSIPKFYGSYDELLEDPEVDAIYCPLPTGMHKEWAMRCLEAGKPLLCEKPITENAAEAREVFRAFEDAGVLISEAYMYRYHPLNHKVKELIRDGAIGEIRSMRSIFNVDLPRTDIRLTQSWEEAPYWISVVTAWGSCGF
jgi:xylose dehydrogenase (NAD/NADP)